MQTQQTKRVATKLAFITDLSAISGLPRRTFSDLKAVGVIRPRYGRIYRVDHVAQVLVQSESKALRRGAERLLHYVETGKIIR
jgi:hypothetical protein